MIYPEASQIFFKHMGEALSCIKLMHTMDVWVATEVGVKVLTQRCIDCGLLRQARLMLSIAGEDACRHDTCICPLVGN